jgi:hypothetical protein
MEEEETKILVIGGRESTLYAENPNLGRGARVRARVVGEEDRYHRHES